MDLGSNFLVRPHAFPAIKCGNGGFSMQALLVVDAQNKFSAGGLRVVPNHHTALRQIEFHVQQARAEKRPIAWVQHHNRPNESRAFVPGTWGAELSPGLGPQPGFGEEKLFAKDVFGAFTGTSMEEWLRAIGVTQVVIVVLYALMFVSQSYLGAVVV